MGVDARHPLYIEFQPDVEQMRETHRGQRIVKSTGVKYLPATSGMIADGALTSSTSDGFHAYDAYRKRAVYPDLVKTAVEAMLGVMHNKPPVIELPSGMEDMRDRATLMNESLEMLLRRINEEQLITGRLGLLLEVPEGIGATMPFIAFYRAESIINWDAGQRQGIELENLNFVSLDEGEFERTPGDFEWEFKRKYRVLVFGDIHSNEPQGNGVYQVGVFSEDEGAGAEFDDAKLVTPMIGGTAANEVPFVFINSKDIVPDPEEPPLLGLSNLTLTIYRGEADYRQALFLQGQDTLVVTGGKTANAPAHKTGAGASIDLPINGDAKYIGVESAGLSEMRTALENDYSRSGKRAGEMMDETSRQKESGEALKVRVSARTATLNQVAEAGAFGLQEILRKEARWLGLNPDEVIVTPNLDFVDDQLSGTELTQIMSAKMLGAPISIKTVHRIMSDRGMTDLNFEEELEQIEREAEIEVLQGMSTTNEDGPEDDEDNIDGGGDSDA